MGRKRKPKIEMLDATPERLERAIEESDGSQAWDYVDPSRIDSHKTIGLVRRFRAAHLDRWYIRDSSKSQLTFRQWYAGDWYRNTHARAGFGLSVVAAYGERVSGSEPAYGMPRTMRQADARKLWREARATFPSHMAAFMDGLLLHDFIPGYASTRAGRKGREAILNEIRASLDCLADWLKIAPNRELDAA